MATGEIAKVEPALQEGRDPEATPAIAALLDTAVDPRIQSVLAERMRGLAQEMSSLLDKRVRQKVSVCTKEGRGDAISFQEFREELGQEHAHRLLGSDERNTAYDSPDRHYDTERISGSLATLIKKIAAEYPELNPRIALLSATDPSGRANTLENLEQHWRELPGGSRLVYPRDWYKKPEEAHINGAPSCAHERLVVFLESQDHGCNFLENTKRRGRFVLENFGDVLSAERRADLGRDLESLDGVFGRWLNEEVQCTDADTQKAAACALTALSLNRNTLPASASQLADISRVVRGNGQDWLRCKYTWLPEPTSAGDVAYAGYCNPGGLDVYGTNPCYVSVNLGGAVVVEVS